MLPVILSYQMNKTMFEFWKCSWTNLKVWTSSAFDNQPVDWAFELDPVDGSYYN